MDKIEQAFKKLFGDMYLSESETALRIFEYGYKAGMEEAKNNAAWAKHLKEPMSEKRVHENDINEPWDTTDMAHRPNGLSMEQSTECVEPVAWLSRDDARLALWDAINKREFGNPTDDKLILDHLRKNGLWIGKYTSPPASKPWVGLTDVEWMNIVNKDHAWFGQRPEDVAHEVAKLVEAKLKEKNT